MELRQLRYFLAVVDGGSVGRAARRLGVSQPALTRYIRSLEHSLGAPLFSRSNEGMTLNHFGRALERRARSVTIEVDRAEHEIRELLGAERGRIVIGTSPSFASTVLVPHVLPAFRATHPSVEVIVIEGFIETALVSILAGEMDFACGTVPRNLAREQFACEVLLPREPIFVVAGRDNPIARRRRVSIEELHHGPWVLGREGRSRASLAEYFAGFGMAAPQPAFLYNSVVFAKQLICESYFIGLMSLSAVRREIAAGSIRVVRVPNLVLERDVGMIYRAQPALSPAATLLIDRVRAATFELRSHLRRRPRAGALA